MGFFQMGTLLGPAVGPIVGGLVAHRWDWHAVFFFLSALGGAVILRAVLAFLTFAVLGALAIPAMARADVLRLRGDYLAIVTLGFGEIIRILMNNLDWLTNGPQGISRIRPPEIFGWALTTPLDFLYVLTALLVVVFLVVWRIEASSLGTALSAVREDQDAARGCGINTTRVKLIAFALSAIIGGICGVMFAGMQLYVSPESFTFWESLVIVLVVVVGGVGNPFGVISSSSLLP